VALKFLVRRIDLDTLFDALAQEPLCLFGTEKHTRLDMIQTLFPDLPCAGTELACLQDLPARERTFCSACRRIDQTYKNYLNYFFTGQREKSTACRSLFISLFAGTADPVEEMTVRCSAQLKRAGLKDAPASDARLKALESVLQNAMMLLTDRLQASLPRESILAEISSNLPRSLAATIASYAVYLDGSSFKNEHKRQELQRQLDDLLLTIWRIRPEDAAWQTAITKGIAFFHSSNFQQACQCFEEAEQQLKAEDRRSNYQTAAYVDMLSYQAHMLMDGSCGEHSLSKAFQQLRTAFRTTGKNGEILPCPRRLYERAYFKLYHPDEWMRLSGENHLPDCAEDLEKSVDGGCTDALILLADLLITGRNGWEDRLDSAKGVQLLHQGASKTDITDKDRAKCERRLAEYYMKSNESGQADAYFEKAARLGSYEAIVHLRRQHFGPEARCETPLSPQSEGRLCLLNSSEANDLNAVFKASLDEQWQCISGDIHQLLLEQPALLEHAQIVLSFMADDEKNNLLSALRTISLLNGIAASQTAEVQNKLIDRIDILLTARDNGSKMLLDAAMSNLAQNVYFRVHLCDPDLMAADELLLRYPTFLPCIAPDGAIVEEKWKHQKKNERCMRRIVILGATRCAYAIVRRIIACTYLEDFPTQLTVIGSGAAHLAQRLREECPGLYSESSVPHITPVFFDCCEDAVPVLRSVTDEEERISTAVREANYLVVAGDDDLQNMSRAVQLRTSLFRLHLQSNRQPLIAVRYRDENTLWIASQVAVGSYNYTARENASSRYHWTENYDLKLFGSRAGFRCSSLLGNRLDQRAVSVHLSYYALSGDHPAVHSALGDYYRRSYNRDSSICMALGLTYHCFAMGVYHPTHEDYSWAAGDAILGNRYQQLVQTEETAEKAASVEHSRWTGWSLANGWTKPSDEELVSYIQRQSPRHYLEIAKLHPYITGYQQLPAEGRRINELLATYQFSRKELPDPRISDRELTQKIPVFLGSGDR